MKLPSSLSSRLAVLAGAFLSTAVGPGLQAGEPVALTPPMGWNSYDCYGTSVTEDQALANAHYLKDNLLAHGWNYLVIDARWYDETSSLDDRDLTRERAGAKLSADSFGRLLPATNRFPSAAGGRGFQPLGAQVHALGLKLGFHLMRGVPRQAVRARTPIEGSAFTAADAGDPWSTCSWCPDMFGVRNNAAGQAWYDAQFRLYASWGLDFVKVDDLSVPYSASEIEQIRHAIDQCGRPIVFSTSPGPTEVKHADHLAKFANQWRVSGDFWDRWKDLDRAFDLLADWQNVGGPGHWPDADMIPVGHLGLKVTIAGPDRASRFTQDEQVTLLSLWALAPSPLMVGGNLPDNDARTLALLTNDDVIAVNQDPLGAKGKRVLQRGKTEVWTKPIQHGREAIGLFNRGDAEAGVECAWSEAGLPGPTILRDLWKHADFAAPAGNISATLPAHGALLLLAN